MGRAGRDCRQRYPDGVLSCATEHLSRPSPLPSFTRMDARKITAEDHIGCVLLHQAYVRKRIFATESSYAFSWTAPRKSGPCGAAGSQRLRGRQVTVRLRCESMPDQLSTLYGDFLNGSYDCVDRVILNAYFTMGQSGGGLRTWWRALYGSEDNLDDNHLMRMAGRFSRRLRAWAKENKIPVVYSSPGERKHAIASEHLATHEVKP